MPRSSVPSSDGDNSLLISPEQNKELIKIEHIYLSPVNKIVNEQNKEVPKFYSSSNPKYFRKERDYLLNIVNFEDKKNKY